MPILSYANLAAFCFYADVYRILYGENRAVVKRQKRHHRQEDEEDNGKAADRRALNGKQAQGSRREAGKAMLDALKPSPMEVVLTLNCIKNAHASGDGEI